MFLIVLQATHENFTDNLVSVAEALQNKSPKAPESIRFELTTDTISALDVYTHPDSVEVLYWSDNGAGKLRRHIPWDQIVNVELYF